MSESAAAAAADALAQYRLRLPDCPEEWEIYHRIRRDVLLEALKYDVELKDELAPGNHPRLLCLNGAPIGSIRVDVVPPGKAALRLVAIDPQAQRRGHGAALLCLAENFARELGCTQAVVYATPEAAGFYSKAGYVEDDWDDAYVGGIVQMVKSLT